MPPPEQTAAFWAPHLQHPSPDLVVTFEYGHPSAPDSPGGQDVLDLHPDGRLALEVRQGRQARTWSARTEPATVRHVLDVLVAVSFPEIPAGRLVPGVSFWVMRARAAGKNASAVFSTNLYRGTPPHGDLLAIGEGLCFRIRGPESGVADRFGVSAMDVHFLGARPWRPA